MKKSAIALLTFAVAILTASCQKENISEQVAEYTPMTINAVANGIDIPATKTSLALKFDVKWKVGDNIYVTDGSNYNTFTLSDGQETPKGSFTQDGTPKSFNGEVKAYYPSSMVQDNKLIWPAVQNYDKDIQTIPMYCETTLTSGGQGAQRMDFTSLGSVLRIAFTTPVAGIKLKSITIKDDETKMSGAFTVDEYGEAEIDETSGTYSITLLDLGDGVDVSNKINYFNIAVPAGHYQKFSITFTATDGRQCVMTGGNIEIRHNIVGILSLTGKAFTIGKGEAAVSEAAGVQGNKVKWVQLWADGPKFAEVNVGVKDGKAESYGGYYTWGSTYENGTGNPWYDDHNTGFSELSHTGDDITDTATKLWGSNWRMPTQSEFDELLANCTCTWTANYNETGVNGLLCTGKTEPYSSNSVFLPAAGVRIVGNNSIGQGSSGEYWTSKPEVYDCSYFLDFNSSEAYTMYSARSSGKPVRAVLVEED